MKRSRSIWVALGLAGVLFLICWPFRSARREREAPQSSEKREGNAENSGDRGTSILAAPPVRSTNATTAAGAVSPTAPGQRVQEGVALDSLKRWIKRREGKDVEVVDAQKIYDLEGKPASMNVLVTTRLGDGLTSEKLKERLDAMSARERGVREQLQRAYQETDIETVNRLVAELTEARTAFVTTNEVTSYKVSLSKEQPPVLAFWPGLPFEMVREAAAQTLATTKLGGDASFQGFVHFTSASALLSFTNKTGSTVYVDPFRITEVPLRDLPLPRAKRAPRADDEGRNDRIAAQWSDFLQP